MQNKTDYIYAPKVDINEGISSGTITKAAMVFTKEYFYVIPFESLKVLGANMESKYHSANDFISDLFKQIPEINIDDFHGQMVSYLPPERIYWVNELDKFTIQVGFWIFGGMRVKKKWQQLQTFNLQPKSLRTELKLFYRMQ
ncbi:MAG: hypothetical protein DRI95_12295 [Bacteroidetes bacterium]|nr:MAG: hypothetical protein DRI95_12295 [Bacteroidota bacterium]